jgi:hypothetical protein
MVPGIFYPRLIRVLRQKTDWSRVARGISDFGQKISIGIVVGWLKEAVMFPWRPCGITGIPQTKQHGGISSCTAVS